MTTISKTFMKAAGVCSTMDLIDWDINRPPHKRYLPLLLDPKMEVNISDEALQRFIDVMQATKATMAFSNFIMDGEVMETIEYQNGSVRDDFDFGPLVVIDTKALNDVFVNEMDLNYNWAGWYSIRLFLSYDELPMRIPEPLYEATSIEQQAGDEEQHFSYVNPRNREVQLEMEQAFTDWLQRQDQSPYLRPRITRADAEGDFPVECSVIIPVRNRVLTIGDAIFSALEQRPNFPFNVIVVDNHSTDGTTEVIARLAADEPRLIHIIPESHNLGIGGCWNLAMADERCGRYAVQLDSDDLYSGPDTLQQVVDCFRREQCAMVVGSYSLTDFNLNPLPPGVIDHREWTDNNGHNNLLRVNGIGAPRAYVTSIARRHPMPNVSYGEDYAMALRLSRQYRIGRIFDVLYLCRRWQGNSDAQLSREKANRFNFYKDTLRTIEILAREKVTSLPDDISNFIKNQTSKWPQAGVNHYTAYHSKSRQLFTDDKSFVVKLLHNPERSRSTAAAVDPASIAARPCFLCPKARPEQQKSFDFTPNFELLVNPYPIFYKHLTIVSKTHQPQALPADMSEIISMAQYLPTNTLLYNGPTCGASAPDHLHLQAVNSSNLTNFWTNIESEDVKLDLGFAKVVQVNTPMIVINAATPEEASKYVNTVMRTLRRHKSDIDCNLLWRHIDWIYQVVIVPRIAHRPSCYGAGEGQVLISPGAIDMAGTLVCPRAEDFENLTMPQIKKIYAEVAPSMNQMLQWLASAEPTISVGITKAEKLTISLEGAFNYSFTNQQIELSIGPTGSIELNGITIDRFKLTPLTPGATFTIHNVSIGKDFHWQQTQNQRFSHSLEVIVSDGLLVAINHVPLESYLYSVIASEMNADAPLEFLKAHAVISRSWALAQIRSKHQASNHLCSHTPEETVRWYDQASHTLFDVCADDHCQRYQGLAFSHTPQAKEAIEATRGRVLTADGEIVDARFSKCCGGITERFSTCWQPVELSYLQPVTDAPDSHPADVSAEPQASQWILSHPDAYCANPNADTLARVLNNYDRSTPHLYRWTVSYSAAELSDLITRKSGIDLGRIIAITPLHRGPSGRIDRLRVDGTEGSHIFGKELEIRRILSESHLYSSAFVVESGEVDADGIPSQWTFHGAGWGHGVGLCQIGAAVMAAEYGLDYETILHHYFSDVQITKAY